MNDRRPMRAECHPDQPVKARGLCRACYNAEWWATHPGRSAEYSARHYAKHPDRRHASSRRWKERNREQVRATAKIWATDNRERLNEQARLRHRANPERKYEVRRKMLYGVPRGWFRDQLVGQAARCAICGEVLFPKTTNIDHDHATGQVRGLLCHHCNRMLGGARDMPARLIAGVRYLTATAAPVLEAGAKVTTPAGNEAKVVTV